MPRCSAEKVQKAIELDQDVRQFSMIRSVFHPATGFYNDVTDKYRIDRQLHMADYITQLNGTLSSHFPMLVLSVLNLNLGG